MDVHSRSTVWCLLDASGEIAAEGKVETRPKELAVLVRELSVGQELVVGQEVGTMAYLVHDALVAAGTRATRRGRSRSRDPRRCARP